MPEIYAAEIPRPEIHPDQECCLGILERRRMLKDIMLEIHCRPTMVLMLRERWRVSRG